MSYRIVPIHSRETQKQGILMYFEAIKDIPFEIKRFYYITNVPAGAERGGHAHKKLKQILFCPYGKVQISLDDGEKKVSVLLDQPGIGLILEPCIWREMTWKQKDSVLCVAVSDYFDEQDYIRDYYQFKQYVKEDQKRES